ncbi:hypothetical protein [Mesorhizobium sp. B1-1-5]|uniref:hypothetical protein n=1 Tax=Mesorhizobium sp. B1-1-5 TaxID=2589979 RepID=UPI00112D0119|nr:hypothetical protein [Mesorhizobium sp. B1-1-5]TPO01007.1 hypothetical protein FJ980_22495 [Mesorhizobium sp. B1-1-5]
MTDLVGPKGLLTSIVGLGAFVPVLLFIIIICYIVIKDLPTMDRQGRYLSHFIFSRKREWKILLSLWFLGAGMMLATAIMSKL